MQTKPKEPMRYLVMIWCKPNATELLKEYENHIAPIMERHGGRIVNIWSAGLGCTLESPFAGFDEIHELHFNTGSGFGAYKEDPELQQWASLREQAVEKAVFLAVTPEALSDYFSFNPPK